MQRGGFFAAFASLSRGKYFLLLNESDIWDRRCIVRNVRINVWGFSKLQIDKLTVTSLKLQTYESFENQDTHPTPSLPS